MKRMRILSLILGSALLSGGLLSTAQAENVVISQVGGTAVGTQISNIATLHFTRPPVTPPDPNNPTPPTTVDVPSNPVTVTVAQAYGVIVKPNGTKAAPGQQVVTLPNNTSVLTWTVQNPGNGTDTFTLVPQADGIAPGDVKFYQDDGDGVFDPAKDTLVTSTTLAPTITTTIFGTFTVPAASSITTKTYVNLVATSVGSTTAAPPQYTGGPVISDQNWGVTVTGDATSGTVDKSSYSCGNDVTCAAPVLIADKTTTGPVYVIPGQYLQYRVVATNTGNGPLLGALLFDTLPTNMKGVQVAGNYTGGAGTLLYSTDKTTWTTTAPNIAGLEGTTVYLGVDSNNDSTITDADTLPQASAITLNLEVRVK